VNAVECVREAEIVEAVAGGRWPDRSDAEVRDHVAGCPVCADLLTVVRALQDEQARAWREASVPAAGLVWWRAQIRARAEAARAVSQPMTFVQAVAVVAGAAVALALIRMGWPWFQGWLNRASSLTTLARLLPEADRLSVATVLREPTLLVGAGLMVCLVLAPIALYLALADE